MQWQKVNTFTELILNRIRKRIIDDVFDSFI